MRGAIICSDYAHSSVESAAQAMDVVGAASNLLTLIDSPSVNAGLYERSKSLQVQGN